MGHFFVHNSYRVKVLYKFENVLYILLKTGFSSKEIFTWHIMYKTMILKNKSANEYIELGHWHTYNIILCLNHLTGIT